MTSLPSTMIWSDVLKRPSRPAANNSLVKFTCILFACPALYAYGYGGDGNRTIAAPARAARFWFVASFVAGHGYSRGRSPTPWRAPFGVESPESPMPGHSAPGTTDPRWL